MKKFLYQLACAEPDRERRDAILALELTEAKWEQVTMIIDLLAVSLHLLTTFSHANQCAIQHPDNAQQSFSQETGPSLHCS